MLFVGGFVGGMAPRLSRARGMDEIEKQERQGYN